MARTKEFDVNKALEKAIEIFWHKGYNGTSAQDLVTHLGLSRSSLYDTFGDKQQLFAQSLRLYQEGSKNQLVQLFEGSDNIKVTLHAIFDQAVRESLDDRITKGCFMVNASIELALHDPEIANIVKRNGQSMEELFSTVIRKGQDLGQISKKIDARVIARFVLNTYSGIRVLARSGERDKKVYDDIVRTMLLLL